MRITCDYDGTGFWSKFKTTIAYLSLKALSRGMQYARKSADAGYHVKCHGLRISFRVSLLIRFFLMEDLRRTLFDLRMLKKPKQIAWTHKDRKPAGRWCQKLMEVIK